MHVTLLGGGCPQLDPQRFPRRPWCTREAGGTQFSGAPVAQKTITQWAPTNSGRDQRQAAGRDGHPAAELAKAALGLLMKHALADNRMMST